MKKKFTMVIALLMAIVMTISPISAYGESEQQLYVSEVKIGYDAEGKAALEEAGYTVRDDFNLNLGGEGKAVWFGYKTTTNKKEAIRDMALMNQGTGYSFQGWRDELDSLQEDISIMVDRFEAAIMEYQKNLKAGSPYAILAKKILNGFIDDDYTSETTDETGYLLGDLFENYKVAPKDGEKAVTKDNLIIMFMQGNASSIETVKYILAFACTEYSADYSGKTFVDRLAEYECTGKLEEDVKSSDRAFVLGTLEDVRGTILQFEKTRKEAEKQYGSEEKYYNTLDKKGKLEYSTLSVLYEELKDTVYTSNLDITLLDLLKLPTEYVNDETPYLADYLVDPFVKSLTAGQLGMIGSVGLQAILSLAVVVKTKESSEETLKNEETMYNNQMKETDGEPASIYDGVDRQLFYDRETVALTSKAIMDNAQDAQADLGKKTEQNSKQSEKLKYAAIGMGVVAAACAGLAVASILHEGWLVMNATEVANSLTLLEHAHDISWFCGSEFNESAFGSFAVGDGIVTTGMFRTFMTVLGAIAIIAAFVLTYFMIKKAAEEEEQEKKEEEIVITYGQIPRVLMDLQYKGAGNNEKYYVPYYATENITPANIDGLTKEAGSEDSLRKYGDLNGLCKKCAWLTLYTTKDENVGNPLTPDFKVVTDGTVPDDYEGVHMFSNTSACNLNQLQLNKAGEIKLYVKPYVESNDNPNGSGSVFTNSPSLLALSGLGLFALGVAAATFATARYYKKKSEKVS